MYDFANQPFTTLVVTFIYGTFFGFGFYLSGLYWISNSLTFDENFKFLVPLTIVLVPAFLALFYGLASFLFLILKPKKNLSSFFLFSLIFGTINPSGVSTAIPILK